MWGGLTKENFFGSPGPGLLWGRSTSGTGTAGTAAGRAGREGPMNGGGGGGGGSPPSIETSGEEAGEVKGSKGAGGTYIREVVGFVFFGETGGILVRFLSYMRLLSERAIVIFLASYMYSP